jgi:FkbM family methyltransferase
MENNLPYLLNLPPFIHRGVDVNNLGFFSKLIFIIKGKIISIITNYANENFFCSLINLFYSKDGKIYFKQGKYIKDNKDFQEIHYPNKRVLRVVNNYEIHLDKLYKTYCIDFVDLKDGDTVIDCGSNVGELYLSILKNNIKIDYIAFEPDIETYECLKINTSSNKKNQYFNLGLSNVNADKEFYFDSEGGNSSFIDFGTTSSKILKTVRLDEKIDSDKIKLLKIDAEGYEPEVLEGAKKLFNKIEYITVDFGAERGIDQNMTIIEVNNILLKNNFELINFSNFRLIGLYKNTAS